MGAFPSTFISKHHTFPAGTQRKATNVFVKEARANHLLPDSSESAALCPDGDLAPCIAASGLSTESVSYVADIIDHAEFDIIIIVIIIDRRLGVLLAPLWNRATLP